jgi:hypothetical protein
MLFEAWSSHVVTLLANERPRLWEAGGARGLLQKPGLPPGKVDWSKSFMIHSSRTRRPGTVLFALAVSLLNGDV